MGRNIDETKIINGQFIDVFAPAISGFGYTSTAYNEGYIKFVFGLASLAVGGFGELFNLKNINGRNLDDYYFSRNRRYRELACMAHVINENNEFDTGRYIFEESETPDIFNKADTLANKFTLLKLKESMIQLEKLTGERLYLEFASVMDLIENAPTELNYLTQLSEINTQIDYMEFPQNPKNVLLLCGDEIYGSGKVMCNGAFWVCDRGSLDRLAEYNKTHKNYALVLSAHNVSTAFNFVDMGYENYNNMSAMIILGKIPYGGTLRGHMEGLLREVKKIAIHDNKLEALFFIKNLMEKMGLAIPKDERKYPIEFNCQLEVIASESKGRGLVTYLG
ncbi:MAG: hypothetical protein WC501_02680 [Candidatus Micrarchaeia archaeon]